jgi:hypothetical protein
MSPKAFATAKQFSPEGALRLETLYIGDDMTQRKKRQRTAPAVRSRQYE